MIGYFGRAKSNNDTSGNDIHGVRAWNPKWRTYHSNNPMWVGRNMNEGILGYIYYMADMIKNHHGIDLRGEMASDTDLAD